MVLWTPTWIGLRTTAVNYLPSVSSNVFEKCLEKFLQCVWKVLYFYYYKIFRKCYHFREWNLGSTTSVFPGWWSHKFVFRIHYLLSISRQDLGFCAKSSMQRKLLKKHSNLTILWHIVLEESILLLITVICGFGSWKEFDVNKITETCFCQSFRHVLSCCHDSRAAAVKGRWGSSSFIQLYVGLVEFEMTSAQLFPSPWWRHAGGINTLTYLYLFI